MKFLVDTQLPPILAAWIIEKGFDATHTADKNQGHLTTDLEIVSIALKEERVIITKDNDFFDHFLVKGAPPKVILLRFGNIKNRKLLDYFRANFTQMINLLNENNFIVCNNQQLFSL